MSEQNPERDDPSAEVQDDLDQMPTTDESEVDEVPDDGVPDPDDRDVEDGVGFHDDEDGVELDEDEPEGPTEDEPDDDTEGDA